MRISSFCILFLIACSIVLSGCQSGNGLKEYDALRSPCIKKSR